jgi:hypothetical protein
MYVFTQNAFLTILAHEHDERLLEVRARYEGDIERTFPEAEVAVTAGADYPYWTAVARDRVAERVALQVQHIGYRKFNPNSEEPWRQEVYSQVESCVRMPHRSSGE